MHHLHVDPRGKFRLLGLLSRSAQDSARENLGLRGYGDVIRHFWTEWTFDRRHGVRTEYLIAADALDIPDPEARSHAERYRATPPYCVATSLAHLSARLGSLGDRTLVDYGSGAGRVMIVAAEAGVGRVIGLELSPELARQCDANLERYRARRGERTSFEVRVADATAFVPPADATIFYFFHPFSAEFFERAMDNIRASVRANPRVIYLKLFQTFRYTITDLDQIADVTGVQTYTNALRPEAFVDRSG